MIQKSQFPDSSCLGNRILGYQETWEMIWFDHFGFAETRAQNPQVTFLMILKWIKENLIPIFMTNMAYFVDR